MALIAGSFSVGCIIGPQTLQAEDAPQYTNAKITFMATQAVGAVVAVTLFCYYVWANREKEKNATSVEQSEDTEEDLWEDSIDKQNASFRYAY